MCLASFPQFVRSQQDIRKIYLQSLTKHWSITGYRFYRLRANWLLRYGGKCIVCSRVSGRRGRMKGISIERIERDTANIQKTGDLLVMIIFFFYFLTPLLRAESRAVSSRCYFKRNNNARLNFSCGRSKSFGSLLKRRTTLYYVAPYEVLPLASSSFNLKYYIRTGVCPEMVIWNVRYLRFNAFP